VDGYQYGDKAVSRAVEVAEIRARLPSLKHVVDCPIWTQRLRRRRVPSPGPSCPAPTEEPLTFDRVPFDHPLYVLYSSGTTGLPKPIVHGHGGILLEHLKNLALQANLGTRRPVLLVQHDRLDDVELPGLGPGGRRRPS
jgi:acetoacetyl-CoA synthetase